MPTARNELDTGPGHEVSDSRRDQHLARCREGGYPLRYVYGNAGDVVISHLDLAGVQPSAHLEAESTDAVADRARAPDRTRRSVERREETITRRLDLLAAELRQRVANDAVMVIKENS